MSEDHGMQGSAAGDSGAAYTRDALVLTAHELRGPITSIVGFAETLRERRHLMTEAQLDDALDAICRQASRLEKLLADLALIAGSRDRVLRLHPEALVAKDALRAILADEGLDDGQVAVECPPDVVVWVDPARLHQMVANYMTNARLHGRPPWSIEVTVRESRVDIAVRDGGAGVAEEYQGSLFGRFQRAPGTTAPGSGLGLAVVRSLATACGGRAFYRPGPPGAHAFVLSLPAAPPGASHDQPRPV
jgi:signal transduction histidine kinase